MRGEAKSVVSLDNLDLLRMKKAFNIKILNHQKQLSQCKLKGFELYLAIALVFFVLSLAFFSTDFFVSDLRPPPGVKARFPTDNHTGSPSNLTEAAGERPQAAAAAAAAGVPVDYAKIPERLRAFASSRLPGRPTGEGAPGWCGALLGRPTPYEKGCGVQGADGRCRDGRVRFFSQYKQDYLLWSRHFRHLGRPGVYADVASNHPYLISNSYFFDRCLSWKGLCVEADPAFRDLIPRHRSCKFVPTCVSDRPERAAFRLDGNLGGINRTNKNTRFVRKNRYGQPVHMLELQCTTLRDQFREANVKHIDYMSLDVEGHELHVLRGVNWDEVTIDILSVETHEGTEIDQFLKNLGYAPYFPPDVDENYPFLKGHELIYLAPGVVMGKPH